MTSIVFHHIIATFSNQLHSSNLDIVIIEDIEILEFLASLYTDAKVPRLIESWVIICLSEFGILQNIRNSFHWNLSCVNLGQFSYRPVDNQKSE